MLEMVCFLLKLSPSCLINHFREVIPIFLVKLHSLAFLVEETSGEQPLDFGQGVLMEAVLSFDYTFSSLLNHLWGKISQWFAGSKASSTRRLFPALPSSQTELSTALLEGVW